MGEEEGHRPPHRGQRERKKPERANGASRLLRTPQAGTAPGAKTPRSWRARGRKEDPRSCRGERWFNIIIKVGFQELRGLQTGGAIIRPVCPGFGYVTLVVRWCVVGFFCAPSK